jgi:5'-phosphate synthase pdxT subunit
MPTVVTIGVLAVQGAFIEHIRKLQGLDVNWREVRQPSDFDGLDGLIIPGGESTTIGKLIERFALREHIEDMAASGKPIWGTCAGMILLASQVDQDTRGKDQPLLGLMDLDVRRNAFGSQLDSFETTLDIPAVSDTPLPAVFIRAPVISNTGPDIEVLSRLDDGRIVAVRQGTLVATAFHPELTDSDAFHRWFLDLVEHSRSTAAAASEAA